MRYSGLVTGFTFTLLLSVPSWAADIASSPSCAVSGPNGKVAAEGGVWEEDGLSSQSQFQGVGSLSFPLGCMLGLQIDIGGADFDEASAFGLGGHLFMRDPSSYLLGIHATYEDWNFNAPLDDVAVWRVGGEAELYLGNVSLEAWAGIEDSDASGSDFFGRATAALYVTEDLRLAAGVRHANDVTSGVLGAEWQFAEMPLSFTVEGQVGEDDFTSISAGFKFYFGAEQKALINRHREDDPNDGLFDFIGGAGGSDPCPVIRGETFTALSDGCDDGNVSCCDGIVNPI